MVNWMDGILNFSTAEFAPSSDRLGQRRSPTSPGNGSLPQREGCPLRKCSSFSPVDWDGISFSYKNFAELAAQPGEEIGFVFIARGLRAAQMHRHQRLGALYHVGRSRLPFLFAHSILFILFHSAQSCSSQQEQSAQTYPTLLALISYPVHYHQYLLITIIHHLLKQKQTKLNHFAWCVV